MLRPLGKEEEEYKEHFKKLKDINKLPQNFLLEQSMLQEDNAYFIEKTINIIMSWSSFIYEHRNEVQ